MLLCLLLCVSVFSVALASGEEGDAGGDPELAGQEAEEGQPGATPEETEGAETDDSEPPESEPPEEAEPDETDATGAEAEETDTEEPVLTIAQKPDGLVVETPVLLVTGQALPGGARGAAENVSGEKSYTLDELRALEGLTFERLYSAMNSAQVKMMYRSQGVDLADLLALSGYAENGEVTALAPDGYSAIITMGDERYYFPNFADDDDSDAEIVGAMLAWKNADNRDDPPVAPEPFATMNEEADEQSLRLFVGQTSLDDVNTSLYNRNVSKIVAGDAIEGVDLTVLGVEYARADLLLMPRAEWSYTYLGQGGERTDTVRGVPMAELLADVSDEAVIKFQTLDNWARAAEYTMSKAELAAKNAILAYEIKGEDGWYAYSREAGDDFGYFRLMIEDTSGVHLVCDISLYFEADNTPAYNQDEVFAAISAGLVPESIMAAGWRDNTSRLAAADAMVLLIEKAMEMTMEEIADENGWDLSTGGFDDTDSRAVTFLKYAEVTFGMGDNIYGAESTFTRAEAVTMIGRIAENCFGIDVKGDNPFTDVPTWAADYVGYAAENEIALGVGGGLFNPSGQLQNQQTALFLIRAFNVWA